LQAAALFVREQANTAFKLFLIGFLSFAVCFVAVAVSAVLCFNIKFGNKIKYITNNQQVIYIS
jgi:hypothetical protein